MRALLDERTQPPLRAVIGALLAASSEADIAVMHVRIAALDLHGEELSGLRRCRMLLGKLDAPALAITGPAAADRRERVGALLRFLHSGVIEIRSAGMSAWAPDFSIYRGLERGGRNATICLIGAHYFQDPPVRGPCFTWAGDDSAAVRRASLRFDELWNTSHDVLSVVIHTIEQYARSAA